jgi:nitrous oxidase accessory protein
MVQPAAEPIPAARSAARANRARTAGWLAAALLIAGAAALAAAVRWPYWRMRIAAPQYPKGLYLIVYANRIEGDVREIDMLNHYIGMKPLDQGARTERRLAIPAIAAASAALLVLAAWRWRWAALLALPSVLIAPGFAADLHLWMRYFGLHLNPKAPLSSAIKPFVPPLFGQGKIAQFDVVATFGIGFWLALAAGALALLAEALRLRPRGRHLGWVAAALALGLPGPASAATLEVGPEGFATIGEAVAAAAEGDTIRVRGGVHRGPLEIGKSVTLEGLEGAVLDGGGRGTVLTLRGPGAAVRGFTIRGTGDILSAEDTGVLVAAPNIRLEDNRFEDVLFGIHVRHAPGTVIRGNALGGKALPVPRRGDAIRVWYSDDVRLEDNVVTDGRDVVLWYSRRLSLRGNAVRGGRYGLHFMYCDDATVEGNRLTGNSVGVYLMYSTRLTVRGNRIVGNRGPSGYGIGLKDMEQVVIEDNLLADNRAGIFLEHASGRFAGNAIAANDVGVWLWPSARQNVFAANSLIDNGEQAVIEAAAGRSGNAWQGNYWSDYRGYDADGDGTGDVPHRAVRVFERLIQRYPALRLYADSPAAQALDVAARLLPIFAPQPTLIDAQPRMRPIAPPARAAAEERLG